MGYNVSAIKLNEDYSKNHVSELAVNVDLDGDHDVEMITRGLLHNRYEVTIRPLPPKPKKSSRKLEPCDCNSDPCAPPLVQDDNYAMGETPGR